MNLKSFLVVSLLCSLGVACSSSRDDQDETTGESSQPLCRAGMICQPVITEPVLAPDEPYTFECPKKPAYPCGPYLVKEGNTYMCKPSCGGGGYGQSWYNPCPWYARNYTCTWYGYCYCY